MQRVFSMYNTYLTPVQLTQLTAPQAMQTPVHLPPAQQAVRFCASALGTSPLSRGLVCISKGAQAKLVARMHIVLSTQLDPCQWLLDERSAA